MYPLCTHAGLDYQVLFEMCRFNGTLPLIEPYASARKELLESIDLRNDFLENASSERSDGSYE